MKKSGFIIVVLLVLGVFKANSQDDDQKMPSIKVISKVAEGSVMLRWAPTTPSAWMKANKYGYIIERFTIKKNDILLTTPKKVILNKNPIMPKPLEDWRSAVENNDYAAIIAQALYGENFNVEGTQDGLTKIINKAQEADQRFSFALFAADMNFEAAALAGLAFVDTSIAANETYFYAIRTMIPPDILQLDYGRITVDSSKIEELPKPTDLAAVGKDKSMLLTWNYELFKSIFTSYYIERSENGTLFKRLNNVPLINMNDKPDAPAQRMFYMDTISENNKKYFYRVQGISPFGDLSPYSDIISASGIKKLEAVAHIDRHDFDSNGSVILQWSFDKDAETQLHGFEVNWAAQEKGPYKRIQEDIAASSRRAMIMEPEPSNYYSITAVGKDNQRTTSLISFVQTIDSIPPSRPEGITGVIDSLGIVKLQWTANTEKDMLGYRVFRGNISNEEFSQITIAPINKTTFTDTVQVKSLNSKVYYKIVAVDQRYNMSEYSEPYVLTKPDVIPPSSPIFSNYKVKDDGIILNWINSSSDDVRSHYLYRQQTDVQEKGWILIFKTETVSSFTDKTAEPSTQYRYAIFAEDRAGLRSEPSTPLTVTSKTTTALEIIKGFNATADRTSSKVDISWRKLPEEVVEIIIYKSKKEEKPVLWKQMPNKVNRIEDISVSPGNIYVYQMKVITKQGNHSRLQTKEVIY